MRHNDYKVRYALAGTDCWGSYITDVIKGFKKTKSSEVVSYMRKHPEEMEKHNTDFKQKRAALAADFEEIEGVLTKETLSEIDEALSWAIAGRCNYVYSEYF